MTELTRITMKPPSRSGQGSPEFNVVVGFVALVFLIVLIITLQKQNEAYGLQVSLDAKRVCQSVADNINMIARNGDGYYRYFSVPSYLQGYTDYNITAADGLLEIRYASENWAAQLITENTTILALKKGENETNCIINKRGGIVINGTCAL